MLTENLSYINLGNFNVGERIIFKEMLKDAGGKYVDRIQLAEDILQELGSTEHRRAHEGQTKFLSSWQTNSGTVLTGVS